MASTLGRANFFPKTQRTPIAAAFLWAKYLSEEGMGISPSFPHYTEATSASACREAGVLIFARVATAKLAARFGI